MNILKDALWLKVKMKVFHICWFCICAFLFLFICLFQTSLHSFPFLSSLAIFWGYLFHLHNNNKHISYQTLCSVTHKELDFMTPFVTQTFIFKKKVFQWFCSREKEMFHLCLRKVSRRKPHLSKPEKKSNVVEFLHHTDYFLCV